VEETNTVVAYLISDMTFLDSPHPNPSPYRGGEYVLINTLRQRRNDNTLRKRRNDNTLRKRRFLSTPLLLGGGARGGGDKTTSQPITRHEI